MPERNEQHPETEKAKSEPRGGLPQQDHVHTRLDEGGYPERADVDEDGRQSNQNAHTSVRDMTDHAWTVNCIEPTK